MLILKQIQIFGIEKIPYAINSQLKKSIIIKNAEEIDLEFHARYNCKQKTYRYIINNSKQGTAVYRGLEVHIQNELNVEDMKKAIKYFIGKHDFSGFRASGTSSKNSIREIYKADIFTDGDRIIIELTGSGFLYNMVRIIAGTLVSVGEGKIRSEDIMEIIKSKDRTKAGKTLQAHGLYLVEAGY